MSKQQVILSDSTMSLLGWGVVATMEPMISFPLTAFSIIFLSGRRARFARREHTNLDVSGAPAAGQDLQRLKSAAGDKSWTLIGNIFTPWRGRSMIRKPRPFWRCA